MAYRLRSDLLSAMAMHLGLIARSIQAARQPLSDDAGMLKFGGGRIKMRRSLFRVVNQSSNSVRRASQPGSKSLSPLINGKAYLITVLNKQRLRFRSSPPRYLTDATQLDSD